MSNLFENTIIFFYKSLLTLFQILLLPINIFIEETLPDFEKFLININGDLSNFFDNISFFFSILPPMTKDLIYYLLTIIIIFYSIKVTFQSLFIIGKLISKFKFW